MGGAANSSAGLKISVPATAPRQSRRTNYVARHWRGEFSLSVSCWVNGVLGNIAVVLAVGFFLRGASFKDEVQPEIALLAIVAVWTSVLIVATWQLVGVWRAASAYSNTATTNPKKVIRAHWGRMAKLVVCIAILRIGGQFFTAAIPQITEYVRIYGEDEEIGKHRFEVLNGGQELEFTGGITVGTAEEFERYFDSLNGLRTVRLTSNGGRVSEARRIAKLINKRNLTTYVPTYCVSACTDIFLGGRQRLIDPGARLGFHQAYFPGMSEEYRKQMIADGVRRLTSLGISWGFAQKARTTPPGKMWYPSISVLLGEHIVTNVLNIGASAQWLSSPRVGS